MKKAIDFLAALTEKDDIIVVFNNDGDGVCSCAVLCSYLEKTGKKKPLLISQPMPPEPNMLKKIQTTVPSKIIFLDMALDHDPAILKRIGALCDILIVDHHIVRKNLNTTGKKPAIVH